MRNFARALLPLALPLLCVHCARTGHRTVAQAALRVHDGYAGAAGGVRLFYRTVGTGRDTVVVLLAVRDSP